MAKYESLYKSLITQDINRGEICAAMLLNYLPTQVQENIKRTLKEDILDIDKVLDSLRTELFTIEGHISAKSAQDHTVDSFSVGQVEGKSNGLSPEYTRRGEAAS